MLLDNLTKYFDAFYRRYLSVTKDTWQSYARFQPTSARLLRNTSHPLWGPLVRRLYRFEGKHAYTQGHILPVNQSLDKSERIGRSRVTPLDLVKKAVRESSYRILLHRCLCRDGFACKDYPRDVGCLMLGEACRRMVETGIARSVTVEEALAAVDRASELGLVSILGWAEFEAVAKGISHEEHAKYFEICFCCPCCCLGLQNYKHMHKNPHMRSIFRSIGWRAQGTEACVACGACVRVCPMECITLEGDGIAVGEACIGCGLCATRCPKQAITMREVVPMKEDLLDYFWGVRPEIA